MLFVPSCPQILTHSSMECYSSSPATMGALCAFSLSITILRSVYSGNIVYSSLKPFILKERSDNMGLQAKGAGPDEMSFNL